MPKVDILFIAVSFLLLPLMAIDENTLDPFIVQGCVFFIATFGIAHGAVDNHLYGVSNIRSNLRFIAVYLSAGIAFAVLWWVQPNLAFISFLIVSAFHFGQSQFSDVLKQSTKGRVIYLSWGAWLLSAFIFFNQKQLGELPEGDYFESLIIFILDYTEGLFYISTVIILGLLFWSFQSNTLNTQRVFRELYEMVLISAVFFLYSPILGFSLYFIILHSLRVLNQEYQYLFKQKKVIGWFSFVKLLSPFTLISIGGLLFFYKAIHWFALELSIPTAALIFISCLTMPHALVMNRFYTQAS